MIGNGWSIVRVLTFIVSFLRVSSRYTATVDAIITVSGPTRKAGTIDLSSRGWAIRY
jgi:hypothetical protein